MASIDKSPPIAPARVFTTCLVFIAIAWSLAATALIGYVAYFNASLLRETIIISVVSGMIAVLSMVPGLLREWMPVLDPAAHVRKMAYQKSGEQNYVGSLFGGMILRLIATVALFVLYRYQMAAPLHWIAAMTIGWYVLMTTAEVVLLARRLPHTDAVSVIASDRVASSNVASSSVASSNVASSSVASSNGASSNGASSSVVTPSVTA